MSYRNNYRLAVVLFYLIVVLLSAKAFAIKEYHGTISDFVEANPEFDDLLEFGSDTEAVWTGQFMSNEIVVEIHTSKDVADRWGQGEGVKHRFDRYSHLSFSSREGQSCMRYPRITDHGAITVYLFEDNFAGIIIILPSERPKAD